MAPPANGQHSIMGPYQHCQHHPAKSSLGLPSSIEQQTLGITGPSRSHRHISNIHSNGLPHPIETKTPLPTRGPVNEFGTTSTVHQQAHMILSTQGPFGYARPPWSRRLNLCTLTLGQIDSIGPNPLWSHLAQLTMSTPAHHTFFGHTRSHRTRHPSDTTRPCQDH